MLSKGLLGSHAGLETGADSDRFIEAASMKAFRLLAFARQSSFLDLRQVPS